LSKQDRHNANVHRISNVAIESLHDQGSRRIHRRESASAPPGKIPYTTKKYVATRSHHDKSTDLREAETLNHDAAPENEVVGNRHSHRSRKDDEKENIPKKQDHGCSPARLRRLRSKRKQSAKVQSI